MSKRKTTEEFIEEARKVHPDYDYSKVNYIDSNKKVLIGCPKHGYINVHPISILRGGGCWYCGQESTHRKTRLTTEEFIEKAKNKFPNYDYSRVKYTNMKTKVIIGCHKHGYFLKSPSDLMQGRGCWDCRNEYISNYFKDDNETFIKKAKDVHPEYNYSKVNYINSQTKVIIGCPKHGDFLVTPNTFLCGGTGCPTCSESKGEKKIRNWFEEHKINYNPQYRFKDLGKYSYDFYLPTYNTLIEYNGKQHYKLTPIFHKNEQGFKNQLKRDELKKDYAEKNGYKLLVIPYTDFNNIESILEKNILSSQK